MPRGVPNPKPATNGNPGNPGNPGDTRSKYDRDRCVNPACIETCSPDCENLTENGAYAEWTRIENTPPDPLQENVVRGPR